MYTQNASLQENLMKRVAVIYGGWSSERDVSLTSGKQMANAARRAGYDVVEIDASRDLATQLTDAKPMVASRAHWKCWASPTPIPACLPRPLPWTS